MEHTALLACCLLALSPIARSGALAYEGATVALGCPAIESLLVGAARLALERVNADPPSINEDTADTQINCRRYSVTQVELDIVVNYEPAAVNVSISLVEPGVFSLHFDGAHSSWLYNTASSALLWRIITTRVQQALVRAVSESINAKLSSVAPKTVLSRLVVTENSVIAGLRSWSLPPQPLPELPITISNVTPAFQAAVSESTLQFLASQAWGAVTTVHEVSQDEVPKELRPFFSTDFFRIIIPNLWEAFPGMKLRLLIEGGSDPAVGLIDGGMRAETQWVVAVLAEDDKTCNAAFSVVATIRGSTRLRFRGPILEGSVDLENVSETHIGVFDTEIIETEATFVLLSGIEVINTALRNGINVADLHSVRLNNPSVMWNRGNVVLLCDIAST
eukprot:m51a1_g4426 hypothetical protein (392) ;mRNA; f:59705-61369